MQTLQRDIQRDWNSVRSREQLDVMLSHQGVTRLEALRAAGPGFAVPIDANGVEKLLRLAAHAQLPLHLTWQARPDVDPSYGCVHDVQATAHGLLAYLEGRRLHLCEDHLSCAWIVRHPTPLGLSCSLELFDAQEQPLLVLSGERGTRSAHTHSDRTEQAHCTRAWRRIVSALIWDSACSSAC